MKFSLTEVIMLGILFLALLTTKITRPSLREG